MSRGILNSEVSCVVALPTLLYPSLLFRKGGTTGAGSSTSALGSYGSGTAASQGTPREVVAPGVILEVRRLWQPPSLATASWAGRDTTLSSASPYSATSSLQERGDDLTQCPVTSRTSVMTGNTKTDANDAGAPLYAFVRVKEVDHRLSGWFDVKVVYVKAAVARSAFSHVDEDPGAPSSPLDTTASPYGLSDDMLRLSQVLHQPWLSSAYVEVTPGMARTQRARRQLDYFEERLLRDCRTPTTVRYFVYLNTYVFAPWYYAPFGLMNSEYDPMLPWSEAVGASICPTGASVAADRGADTSAGVSAEVQQQPFIRDAFLCPFSLRIYSTYEQMHYETRTYRAGRLRPPGEEIYRDEVRGLSLFKINGGQHVTYCRHLFLIGKSFLENKLAGHDVHNYYFYVLCLHHRYFPEYASDPSSMYFAGFFTWEKHASEYNLACIATLPCFGRRASRSRPAASPVDGAAPGTSSPPQVLRHLGQFMIAVSYELAYRRKQIGTPEKPLSDLGAIAYQHFWRRAIVRWMKETLNAMRRASAVCVDTGDGEMTVLKGAQGAEAYASQEARLSGRDVSHAVGAGAASVDVIIHVAEDGVVQGEHGADGCHSGEGPGKLHEHHSKSFVSARKRSRADASAKHEKRVADSVRDRLPSFDGKVLLEATTHPFVTKGAVSDLNAAAQSPTGSSPITGAAVFAQRTTIREIAAAVRLEEADVLTTLLGMGVLHRSSEDRGVQLLLPQRYVDWVYDEMLRLEGSTEHAVFQSALLKSRGSYSYAC